MKSGYTLLEIVIATGVLVIGLAAVFGMAQSARKKSVAASDLASVQLVCQTTLNELLARQSPIEAFAPKNLVEVPEWKIALWIYPSPQTGIYVLHLTTQKFTASGDPYSGSQYQLIRWVPQHRVRLPDPEDMYGEMSEFDDPYGQNRQDLPVLPEIPN